MIIVTDLSLDCSRFPTATDGLVEQHPEVTRSDCWLRPGRGSGQASNRMTSGEQRYENSFVLSPRDGATLTAHDPHKGIAWRITDETGGSAPLELSLCSWTQFQVGTRASDARTTCIKSATIRSSAPYSRRYTVNSFEGAVERRLIRKSASNGDVRKGQAGIHHEISGPIDAAFNQPPIRRTAKGLSEGSSKVTYR